MRILLAASHRFPAFGPSGAGLHPKDYPSGSAYHIHDLLAKGLAEEGHQVFYYVRKGAESAPPRGVQFVPELIAEVDVCHAPIDPVGLPERLEEFAIKHRIPYLFTCHMKESQSTWHPNWLFVSRSLARFYNSERVVLNAVDPGDLIFSETKDDYLVFIGAMHRALEKGLDVALSLARRKGFRLIVAGTGMRYETIRQISELCAAAGAEYRGDVRGACKAELIAGARAPARGRGARAAGRRRVARGERGHAAIRGLGCSSCRGLAGRLAADEPGAVSELASGQ
jgi:hypothetical protein